MASLVASLSSTEIAPVLPFSEVRMPQSTQASSYGAITSPTTASPLASNTQTSSATSTDQHSIDVSPASNYDNLPAPSGLSRDDFLDVMNDWTGTGERFDVDYNSLDPPLKLQLKKREKLGQGHFGEVCKVTYRGVDLARKSIKIRGGVSEEQVRQLQEEATLGQKLDNHRHIVKLIGTYWKGDHHLNILIYPVAICDLGKLLIDFQNLWPPNEHQQDRTGDSMNDVRRRLDGLGLGSGLPPADDHLRQDAVTQRLKKVMGCTTQGLLWMHSQGIYHRDLKPQNILLRAGEVYLTDFGISRDGNAAESSTTERHVGHTLGYAAPEVLDQDAYNPRQADIFSLGCLFLHILAWCTMVGSLCARTPILPPPSIRPE